MSLQSLLLIILALFPIHFRDIDTLLNIKILSNILLSGLIPYAEEVIRDHQCGLRRNRSTTDHIFCIRQILEKKWE